MIYGAELDSVGGETSGRKGRTTVTAPRPHDEVTPTAIFVVPDVVAVDVGQQQARRATGTQRPLSTNVTIQASFRKLLYIPGM